MAIVKDEYISVDHKTSVNSYALLGNSDALRSMDVVIIPWDKCLAIFKCAVTCMIAAVCLCSTFSDCDIGHRRTFL
jgi:hypothetical protein